MMRTRWCERRAEGLLRSRRSARRRLRGPDGLLLRILVTRRVISMRSSEPLLLLSKRPRKRLVCLEMLLGMLCRTLARRGRGISAHHRLLLLSRWSSRRQVRSTRNLRLCRLIVWGLNAMGGCKGLLLPGGRLRKWLRDSDVLLCMLMAHKRRFGRRPSRFLLWP